MMWTKFYCSCLPCIGLTNTLFFLPFFFFLSFFFFMSSQQTKKKLLSNKYEKASEIHLAAHRRISPFFYESNCTISQVESILEKEEHKWKEIEASLISSIHNARSRKAAAMATAVRAVGGDSVLSDSFIWERVSSIAYLIRTTQLGHRALQVVKRGTTSL